MGRIICLVVVLLASFGHAQVGIKSGGGGGSILQQKRLELTADVKGHFAKVHATHIFKAGSDWRTEMDIIYTLPDGAIPTEFAYYYQGERVPAFITEKERAAEIYKSITTRMQDPALIEFIGKKTFRVRIFPVEPNQDLRMEVGWIQIAKTEAGVPKFDFPIKMRPKDPLSEVKAKITVERLPWMKGVAENIGLQSVTNGDIETYSMDQKAVRPRKDWRFALMPKEGQIAMTIKSARSGSDVGYAAVAISPPGKSSTITVESLNSPESTFEGGTKVTTGTYRSQTSAATVRVNNISQSVELSQEAEPNHQGLKLWAYQRLRSLEKSSKNREKVVEMSLRHNLISKFTSWIAIPIAERERFAQEIKEARLRVKARQLSSDVVRGKVSEAVARGRYNELHKEIVLVAKDAKDFESEYLHDQIYRACGAEFDKFYNGGRSLSAKRKMYLRLEKQLVTLETRLNWLGGTESERRGYYNIQGFDTMLVQQILGEKPRFHEDWSYMQKHCRTLYKASAEISKNNVYHNACSQFLQRVATSGKKANDAEVVRRLDEFKQTHSIKVSSEHYVYVDFARYSETNTDCTYPSQSELEQIATLAFQIGVADKENFLANARKTIINHRSNFIRNKYYDQPLTNTLILKARKEFAMLPLDGAETCMSEFVATKLSERNNNFMDAENRYPSKEAYLKEYKSRLEKLAGGLPELKPHVAPFIARLDERFTVEMRSDDKFSSYWYVLQDVGRPQSERDQAKKEVVDRMVWLGIDRSVANKRLDELKLGTRFELIKLYREESTDVEKVKATERALVDETLSELNRSREYAEARIDRLKNRVGVEKLLSGPQTAEVKEKLMQMDQQLESIVARVGDPLLSVALPAGTLKAMAVFPWGETRALTFNAKSEEYQVRFDIPPTATEGDQQIAVLAVGLGGAVSQVLVPLRVDMTAPKLSVRSEGGKLIVQDLSKEVRRMKAFGAEGQQIELVAKGSVWTSVVGVSAVDDVQIFAFDGAHNVAHYVGSELVVTNRPKATGVEDLSASMSHELAGQNIQAVAHWQGIDFAGTLDEGLYYRRGGEPWALVPGLPSGAARQFVRFGNELAIRFGSGDLVALNEKLEVRSLNNLLPRQQALAIHSDGSTLVVAQTGGYSLLGEKATHEFGIAELAGGAPSAVAISADSIALGIQGRGFFRIDRSTRAVTQFAEPQGLTDDWVTSLAASKDDLLVGTFAAGLSILRYGKLLAVPAIAGMQVTAISPTGYVATRTGLYRVVDGNTVQINLGGLTEIQSVIESGDDLLVATRIGVFRVATK